jgi:RNA recognition motif-containing protein
VRVFGHELRVALSKHNEVAGASKNDNAGERLLSRDYTNSLLHRFRVIGSKNYQNICAPNAVLHVSNLGPHVDEDAVRRIFEAYGTVHMVRFLPSKNQNREATEAQARRMALVRMDTVEAAVGALVYTHSTEHYGLSLRVSFAKNHDAQ